MADPLKDHFVRTVAHGITLPERGNYIGDAFVFTAPDGSEAVYEWNGEKWLNTHAKDAPVFRIEATPDFRSLLSALIHQIELGDFTDQHGHKLTNNVHFIKAKEAVGE